MSGRLQQIPFRLGIEEGSDPKALPPGTLVLAENARMDKAGRITKRYGTSGLPKDLLGGGTISTGRRIASRGDLVAVLGSTALYQYNETSEVWKNTKTVPQYRTEWETVADTVYGVGAWDAVVAGGYEVVAWSSGDPWGTAAGGVFYMVRDYETGAIVLPPTAAGFTGATLRLQANDQVAYLVTAASGNLKVCTITPSTGAISAQTTLETDVATSNAFDALMIGTTRLVVAYNWTGANPKLQTRSYVADTWGAASSDSVAGETSTFLSSIALAGSGTSDVIYVAWSSTTAAETRIATIQHTSLALVNSILAVEAALGRQIGLTWISSGNCLVTWANSADPRAMSAVYLSAAGGSISTTTKRGSVGAFWASKPVLFDSKYYALVTSTALMPSSKYEPTTTALVEIETSAKVQDYHPHRHVATIDVSIGGWSRISVSPSAAMLGVGTSAVFYSPFQSSLAVSGGFKNARQGLRRVVMRAPTTIEDFGESYRLGAATYMNLGLLGTWDGAKQENYGFLHAPSIVSLTPGGGGTGSMTAGDYSYSAVAEYRDASGVLQRSPIATPVETTAVATGSVTVRVTCQCLSHHEPSLSAAATSTNRNVTIALYRTTQDGTVLYRLSADPQSNVITNDPFAGFVDFVDTVADTDIDGLGTDLQSRPFLYTSGGSLDDQAPPSFLTSMVHQGRIWGLSGDSRTVFVSQDINEDPNVAPGFNIGLSVTMLTPKVAMASLDDKAVMFGADDIDIVTGDGPPPNGIGSYWRTTKIQTDVGCTNPRSIVSAPLGVLFQSRRGIELLDRGLNVTWLGQRVEDTIASYPKITSAVLVPDQNEIRWTCLATNLATGVVLVYDYSSQVWFVRKYTDGVTATAPFVDAALIDGEYFLLTSGGQVYRESKDTFLDDGATWVTLRLRTAWLAPAGPLAWHRISELHLLGTSVTNHDLTITLARDFVSTAFQTKSYTAGGATTVTGSLEACRVSPTIQKLQALQITITDATPTSPGTYPVTTGQGPILEGFALRVSPKPGAARKPATQQG